LGRNINNDLGKNRRILESFLKLKEETANIHKDQLLEKKIRFKYVTHIYTDEKRESLFFLLRFGLHATR